MLFFNGQKPKLHAGTPTMNAIRNERVAWMKHDEERYNYYKALTNGVLNIKGMDRLKFEYQADQLRTHMIREIDGIPELRKKWDEKVNDLEFKGKPVDEATILDDVGGNLEEENMGLLASYWDTTQVLRAVFGYQPIRLPKSRAWYRKPATKAQFVSAGGTYAADTEINPNLKRTGGSFITDLYEQDKETAIPFIHSKFNSQAVSADAYKLGYREAVEDVQDFRAYFGANLLDLDAEDVVKTLARMAQYYAMNAAVSAVTDSDYNETYDADGYTDHSSTESFTALWKWAEYEMGRCLGALRKTIYAATGEYINTIVGSPTTLDPFFKMAHQEGLQMKFSDEAENRSLNGDLGKAGGYFVGTFEKKYRIYCVHDWPSTTKSLALYKGQGNDFRSQFDNAGVFCPYKVGFRSMRTMNNTHVNVDEAFMDRWDFIIPDETVSMMGTITLG